MPPWENVYLVVVFLRSGLVPKIGVLLTEGRASSRKEDDIPGWNWGKGRQRDN